MCNHVEFFGLHLVKLRRRTRRTRRTRRKILVSMVYRLMMMGSGCTFDQVSCEAFLRFLRLKLIFNLSSAVNTRFEFSVSKSMAADAAVLLLVAFATAIPAKYRDPWDR
jgi:hypothetical protein